MINILYLHAGSELYGADIILYNIVKNLDKNKFTPYVILPSEGPLVDKIRKEGIFCEVVDYPILRRKYFNLKGMFYYIFNFNRKSKKIMEKIDGVNVDIIHNNTAAVLEGFYLKKKLNARLIMHCHEIIKKPKFLNIFYSWLFAKKADLTMCVSEAVKNNLEKNAKFKNKIKICYNGINNDVYKPKLNVDNLKKEFNIPDEAVVVGMIGRINAWKGQNDFLEAIEKIGYKKNVYYLIVGGVFAGEEWRVNELKEKIFQSSIKEMIRLIDFRTDVNYIHNLIDIFVLPSTNPDPLPTVVLEAMATGKPIVAYRHGGVCEMCVDNNTGFLVDVRNTDELANKIEKLIECEDVRKKMGNEALIRQLNNFSLESQMKNVSNIYEGIL